MRRKSQVAFKKLSCVNKTVHAESTLSERGIFAPEPQGIKAFSQSISEKMWFWKKHFGKNKLQIITNLWVHDALGCARQVQRKQTKMNRSKSSKRFCSHIDLKSEGLVISMPCPSAHVPRSEGRPSSLLGVQPSLQPPWALRWGSKCFAKLGVCSSFEAAKICCAEHSEGDALHSRSLLLYRSCVHPGVAPEAV